MRISIGKRQLAYGLHDDLPLRWTNVAFRRDRRALTWRTMIAEPLRRLKDLVDQLERLPASPDRDRMLTEVRSRVVDVDTGVTPRAMLPLREPTPPPLACKPRPERYRPRAVTRTPSRPRPFQPARPAPARATAD